MKPKKAPYKRYLIPTLFFAAAVLISACSASTSPKDPPHSETESRYVAAYKLTLDGKEVAFLTSKDCADAVRSLLINAKTDELIKSGKTPVSVSVNTDISLEQTSCPENEISEPQKALERYYADGGAISYTVILSEDLTEIIPFKTVYQNSATYYEGEKVTSVSGKNGEKLIKYEVTYKDGAESSRVLVSEQMISPATDKIVLVGTKKSTVSTGKYAFPLKNMYITSSYGGRYLNSKYDFHLGVDLRAAKGTSVYASDGGEVIFSGYMGSYGYLIKIQHDNGDVTYYAHLSSLGVKKGVRVYKGQYIAKSGATGNVTGAHLHFEIRRNGKTVDPLTLLPKF